MNTHSESVNIIYYNTRSIQKKPGSTAKCMVRHKKHGSTQKGPVRHKNAPPSMHQLTLPLSLSTPPPPPPLFCFKNPQRNEKEIIFIWIQIYSISLWKLICNYSFLFVMTIMSAAINDTGTAEYSAYFCISLDCSIKIWHERRAELIAGSIMHSTKTFVITVSNERVSCRPHLEEKLRTLLLM